MEEFTVELYPAGLGVQAKREKIMPIERRRGEPDLPSHYHRRGPATERDLRRPFDVFRLRPMKGETEGPGIARGGDVTIAHRSAPLGPLCPRTEATKDRHRQHRRHSRLCRYKKRPAKTTAIHGGRMLGPTEVVNELKREIREQIALGRKTLAGLTLQNS